MKRLRQVVLFSLTLKKIAVALSAFVLLSNLSPISPFDAPEANALSLQTGVTDVAAGTYHSCAVVSGGLQCWGANGQGQLGDNTKTARTTPIAIFQPNSGVTAVSTGWSHTCAVVSGGVKCWGRNNAFQLGDGTTTQRLLPVDAIPANTGATAISAGVSSTCAVVSGGVQCWGNMDSGVSGNGDSNGLVSTPYQTLPAGSGATSVSVGTSTACAIVSNSLWCWGDNSTGMYGNGTTNGSDSGGYPLSVSFTDPGLTAVSVGWSHVCAVISGGVQCWGRNNAGQLGDGTTNDSIDRVTAIAANSGATSVTASASNTCAAVAGGVKCWGKNDQNQLGNGDTSTQSIPVDIIPASSGVTSVKSFWWHTCAIVSSAVKCWGYNNAGQTGDSRKINNSTPFTVTSLTVTPLYAVTFDSKGGSAIDSASFISGGSVSAPASPIRTGYTLLGWSATDGGSAVSFPYSPAETTDITLYAKWSINTYVFIYNSKGGTSVTNGSFVYEGLIANAPRNPYRSGAVFMGWSATDGGSAISFPYTPGVASNVTLYAKWAFLAPLLSTSSATSVAPGESLSIKISRVNEGCMVSVSWLQENTGVSEVSKVMRADRTSGVFTFETPSIAGRYTLKTSTIGSECSNGAAVTLAKAFVVGKKSSVIAKLSSSTIVVSKNPVVTVSGKVKTGSVAVVGRAMNVSLRRNGVEVASATVTTDSSGAFTASFSGITYQAGEYSTLVTGVADSSYLASEGIGNKLTLR